MPHSRDQLGNKTAGQAAVAVSWADRVSPGAVTHVTVATGAMCPTLGAHQFEPNQVRCTACLTRTLSCRIFRRRRELPVVGLASGDPLHPALG
nr:hypothetical protein [Mycobacterium canetti]